MSDVPFEFTVDDLVQASELAELTDKAERCREEIAQKLERLAMDVRINRHSPMRGFVLFLEPDKSTIHYLGKDLTYADVDEASDMMRDAWRAQYLFSNPDHKKRPDETVVEGSIRRKEQARERARKAAAKKTEFAYECQFCHKGHKTRRGKDQHERIQLKEGCIKCSVARCAAKGASFDYTNNWKGDMTCFSCLKASKSEE